MACICCSRRGAGPSSTKEEDGEDGMAGKKKKKKEEEQQRKLPEAAEAAPGKARKLPEEAAGKARKLPEEAAGKARKLPEDSGAAAAEVGGGKLVHFDGALGFTADGLLCATAEVLGKSTYGTVYKATFEDGAEVAVKRLREGVVRSQREFEAEVNALGRVRHPNLLPLRGYYWGPKNEKLLIFDFMPGGSLSAFLHGKLVRSANAAFLRYSFVSNRWDRNRNRNRNRVGIGSESGREG
jgi:hypothetical protein